MHNPAPIERIVQQLRAYGPSITNAYRKERFSHEYEFFQRAGQLEKCAILHLMQLQLKAGAYRRSACTPSSAGSYLFTILKINLIDPLDYDLVFEAVFDSGHSLFPGTFVLGTSERDRLIPMLEHYCREGDLQIGDDTVIAEITEASALCCPEKILRSEALIPSAQIRFTFEDSVDTVHDVIESVRERHGIHLSPLTMPYQHSGKITKWDIMEDLSALGMENLSAVAEALTRHKPQTPGQALALTAIYSLPPDKADALSKAYLSHSLDDLPSHFTYHCLGLLDETGGFLLFKEQAYHIIRLISGMSHSDAVELVYTMRLSDQERKTEAKEIFFSTAQRRSAINKAIYSALEAKAALLVSKQDALCSYMRLFQPVYLKNSFPDMYRSVLQKQLTS